MRSTDDQSTIRWLLVVGLYCFRGLNFDFNQNLSLCDRCTKSVRLYLHWELALTVGSEEASVGGAVRWAVVWCVV